MALTHPIDRTAPAHETRDSFLHVVARDFQWVLRGLCLLFLIATVVFMATFWYAAIPTVIMLLLTYIALVIIDGIEARTDHRPHDETAATGAAGTAGSAVPADEAVDAESQRRQERTVAIERRLTRISMEVLGGTLVLAVALAAVAFHWKVLPIAGLVLVGYIILVTAPVWGAWMESDVEDEVVKRRVD